MSITVTKGLIGREDINFEPAGAAADQTFSRTKAGGSLQNITQFAAAHINIRDLNARIAATNVEDALQEIAGDVDNVSTVFSNGKGSDISSASNISLPSRHLYFDVTGTTLINSLSPDTGAGAGRVVVLQFDSALTVRDGTIRLAGDFKTQTGAHLGLIYDGAVWYELFRSDVTLPLHSGPFTDAEVDRLGPVKVSSSADTIFNRRTPVNGFIGGQTEFI